MNPAQTSDSHAQYTQVPMAPMVAAPQMATSGTPQDAQIGQQQIAPVAAYTAPGPAGTYYAVPATGLHQQRLIAQPPAVNVAPSPANVIGRRNYQISLGCTVCGVLCTLLALLVNDLTTAHIDWTGLTVVTMDLTFRSDRVKMQIFNSNGQSIANVTSSASETYSQLATDESMTSIVNPQLWRDQESAGSWWIVLGAIGVVASLVSCFGYFKALRSDPNSPDGKLWVRCGIGMFCVAWTLSVLGYLVGGKAPAIVDAIAKSVEALAFVYVYRWNAGFSIWSMILGVVCGIVAACVTCCCPCSPFVVPAVNA